MKPKTKSIPPKMIATDTFTGLIIKTIINEATAIKISLFLVLRLK